ncbi:hypothetical protein CR513_48114, partial [Mucuna pruriens]
MEMNFKEGDLVWVHLRKERFPHLRKSKLLLRGDGPFKIVKKINDNSYKVDMPQEYEGSTSFNRIDFPPFDVGSTQAPNLRSNSLQEGENDAYVEGHGHIPHKGFKEFNNNWPSLRGKEGLLRDILCTLYLAAKLALFSSLSEGRLSLSNLAFLCKFLESCEFLLGKGLFLLGESSITHEHVEGSLRKFLTRWVKPHDIVRKYGFVECWLGKCLTH